MTETAEYVLEDGSVVLFQYQPDRTDGARQVGSRRSRQLIEERLTIVVGTAREIIDSVRDLGVDSANVEFGITLTGGLNWAVAHTSAASSFKVSLTWSAADRTAAGPPPSNPETSASSGA